uniref:CCHC-type domain-containing protein n=1 Tax=Fagus sylvatica TaxID=28930 RepID=A0A2N9FWA6_FAGSY
MDRNIQEREFGWTDSSESDQSEEVYDGDLDMEESSDEDLDLHAPLARHGPIIRANPSELAIQREYWHMCAIAFLLDYRKFSVAHLQHTINNAWRIRGNVNVVGRDSRYFILHFDVLDDLLYICGEGPWAVDGALLVMERWRPNLVIHGLQLNYVSLWVQLHGLPLEYQYPELAMQMGQIMGTYERIDWDAAVPRNIRFMRIRVRMDPWLPLIAGFMLRMDNGDRVWIQCRYERIHKVCTKCGLIGHTRTQCTYIMADIEHLLHRQRQRIQREFQVQYGFDPLEPHFVNELRAFYNRPHRQNTQIRFGTLARDTGYRQRQHQQGGAPPPQPNPFPPTLHRDDDPLHVPNPGTASPNHVPETQEGEHATTELNTEAHFDAATAPFNQVGTNENFNLPQWQPPENSNLRWIRIEDEEPFLTNANMIVLGNEDPPPVANNMQEFHFTVTMVSNDFPEGATTSLEATPNTIVQHIEPCNVDSSKSLDDQQSSSLIQRMNRDEFRFEAGEPSQTALECQEEEAIDSHRTILQAATCETGHAALTLTWLQDSTGIDLHQFSRPTNLSLQSPLSLLQPNCPGPPHSTNQPMIAHMEHTNRPNPTIDHVQTQSSNLIFTLDSSSSTSSDSLPPPTMSPSTHSGNPITSSQSSHNPRPKKRFRKEFGWLGRNLRQRLFCGLFSRAAAEEQHQWDIDSIMVVEDRFAQLDMANGSAHPITSYSSQSDGFWEADPLQLPQAP